MNRLLLKQRYCEITGLPIIPGPEFWLVDSETKHLLSVHKSEAAARARIRWIHRKVDRISSLKILDMST